MHFHAQVNMTLLSNQPLLLLLTIISDPGPMEVPNRGDWWNLR